MDRLITFPSIPTRHTLHIIHTAEYYIKLLRPNTTLKLDNII